MDKEHIATEVEGVAAEREQDQRLPYTRPHIESSDAFESFTLTSCGLIPEGCIDGTNP